MPRKKSEKGTAYCYDGPLESNIIPESVRTIPTYDEISVRDEVVDKLSCQMGKLADLVREYLKNTRVRANAGFKPERCVACDVPHPAKLRACHCPHHKLIELLNELGYPAAEVTLYG